MTNDSVTHIAMLLDRSGSMQSIKKSTEVGFDAFIAEQRQQPGTCTVTLAQFDDVYDEVYTDRPIADVPTLELQPRGSTALLDSMARLIHSTGERLAALPEDDRPGTVIVGIMTDGHENASVEYTHAAIRALVEQQERDYQWEFLYLGANQDAIEVGAQVGIRAERAMTFAGEHTADAYHHLAGAVSELRAAPAAQRSKIAFSDQAREDSAGRRS